MTPARALQALIPSSAHEIDFLPAALEIMERPASPLGRGITLTLCAITISAIAWATIGKVDIIATAPGKIIPVGNSKLIQPLETGVVQAVQAKDGQHVQAGQILVQLDPVSAQADRDRYASDLTKTQLEIARLRGLRQTPPELVDPPAEASPTEIDAARAAMRAQAVELQAKLANLQQQIVEKNAEAAEATADIDKLQASLPLSAQVEDLRRQAKEIQFGNKLAWLEAQQHLVEQQHDLPALTQHRVQAVASALALQQQVEQAQAEFDKTVLTDLADAEQKASEFASERDKAAQRLSLLSLRAPIDGTVQQVSVHTIGGVVTPAQQLMVVVPDDGGLVVEARIQNKDVGFVHAGQEAELKIGTFTFTRYGLVHGTVLDVSRDAVEAPAAADKRGNDGGDDTAEADAAADTSGYVAHISLSRTQMMTEGGPVDLGPGMQVTTEIKTGQRRVIAYVLSPVLRYRQESFRER